MICYIKEIQGLLSTLTKKVLFFKDFKALKNQWWISSTFKHFKDLYEPCKGRDSTLLKFPKHFKYLPRKQWITLMAFPRIKGGGGHQIYIRNLTETKRIKINNSDISIIKHDLI